MTVSFDIWPFANGNKLITQPFLFYFRDVKLEIDEDPFVRKRNGLQMEDVALTNATNERTSSNPE